MTSGDSLVPRHLKLEYVENLLKCYTTSSRRDVFLGGSAESMLTYIGRMRNESGWTDDSWVDPDVLSEYNPQWGHFRSIADVVTGTASEKPVVHTARERLQRYLSLQGTNVIHRGAAESMRRSLEHREPGESIDPDELARRRPAWLSYKAVLDTLDGQGTEGSAQSEGGTSGT